MRLRGLLGLAFLSLLLSWPGISQGAHDAGSESALYLDADARAMGLGRTGVTAYESPLVAVWNPAALSYLPQFSLMVQHASLLAGAVHQTIALAYPTMDLGTIALTGTRLEIGGIERRDVNNLPGNQFSMLEQELALAYGYTLWNGLALGATLKIHELRLDDRQSASPGLNAGVMYKLLFSDEANPSPLQEIRAGLALRNAVSPSLRLDQDADRLLPTWKLGFATVWDIIPGLPDRLLVQGEVDKPEQAEPRWHAGLEYGLYQIIAVRGGWDHEYFSAGAGVTYAGVQLDYAVSFPAIGLRHLATLTVALGQDMNVMRSQRAAEEERKRKEIVDNLKQGIINDYQQQAKTLTDNGDLAGAVKLWGKVLDWEPGNVEAKASLAAAQQELLSRENAAALKLANEYYAQQKYIDVMVECRNVLDRDPKHSAAQSLYQQAEDKATRLGNNALSMNMKTLETIRKEYQLGLQAYTARDWEKAIEHWEQVIETTPLQKQVYSYLNTARSRLAQAKAETMQNSQTTQIEGKRQKLYKEAVELSRNGKLKDAVRSWENLVKENPQDQDSQRNFEKTRQDLIDSQKKGIRW